MVIGDPGKKPAVCDRQLQVPNPDLSLHPEPGFAHPLPSAASGPAGLGRTGTTVIRVAPVLIETFVEIPRFTGGAYKVSGWVHVGTSRGRGKYDTKNECAKP